MLTNRAKTLIICGYLIFRGIAQVVEQRSPKPRAEGSNPSAPATGKALKPLGFRAFSLFFRERRTVCFAALEDVKAGSISHSAAYA